MLIELGPGIIVRQSIEVREQIGLDLRSVTALPNLSAPGLPAQVVD